MEEPHRSVGPRAVLALVAVMAVAAVIWAATALAAGGGSSPNENGARDSPAPASVQNDGGAADHDCPNRDSGSAPSADV